MSCSANFLFWQRWWKYRVLSRIQRRAPERPVKRLFRISAKANLKIFFLLELTSSDSTKVLIHSTRCVAIPGKEILMITRSETLTNRTYNGATRRYGYSLRTEKILELAMFRVLLTFISFNTGCRFSSDIKLRDVNYLKRVTARRGKSQSLTLVEGFARKIFLARDITA